jgi:hypothetical protein
MLVACVNFTPTGLNKFASTQTCRVDCILAGRHVYK